MGTAEIAEHLGVSRQWVEVLSKRRGFPEPAVVLKSGRIWHTEDVDQWAAEHRPQHEPDESPQSRLAMDLVALSDVARMLGGVSRSRATEITNRKGFPAPVTTVANGRLRIWRQADVEHWIREHRPHQAD